MAEVQQTTTPQKAFEVRVDAARHSAFADMHDAIDAAKIVKRERPQAVVNVVDNRTGQVVVEPDA